MNVKNLPEIIQEVIPYYKKKGKPEVTHSLVYESSSETLEPVYFFILDLMNEMGLNPEKFVDNFSSSPGSGHFSELGQKATMMQQQATKIMGDVNVVLRSVLNIIYDLKEFKIRLQSYSDLKSSDKTTFSGARLSLKQIWMDKVDIAKGNSSIKAMALGQAGYQTLIDAFLMVDTEKDVDRLDLNDRVKRILRPRIMEFNSWVLQSEKELRKRYELERAYLKSQVNSLKLYSRWVKPYLRAAYQLEMKDQGRSPDLVSTFNTIILELTLLGKSKINIEDAAMSGNLPKDFLKMKFKRDYYSCIVVEFKFRGIPQRVSQQSHYAFGGKAEVSFKAYALNSDEIKKVEKEFEKSDLEGILNLIEGASTESLTQLMDEINSFLEEDEKEKEKEEKKSSSGTNPFKALFGGYEKGEKKEEKKDDKKTETNEKGKNNLFKKFFSIFGFESKKQESDLKEDSWIEKTHLRTMAVEKSTDTAFNLFDIYKKAHGMASYT